MVNDERYAEVEEDDDEESSKWLKRSSKLEQQKHASSINRREKKPTTQRRRRKMMEGKGRKKRRRKKEQLRIELVESESCFSEVQIRRTRSRRSSLRRIGIKIDIGKELCYKLLLLLLLSVGKLTGEWNYKLLIGKNG